MTDVELETTGYQVEVIGVRGSAGRRLVVDGHDISRLTTGVVVRVPASGPVEVEVDLSPDVLYRGAVEPESLRYYIEGVTALLRLAQAAEEALVDAGNTSRLVAALRAARIRLEKPGLPLPAEETDA